MIGRKTRAQGRPPTVVARRFFVASLLAVAASGGCHHPPPVERPTPGPSAAELLASLTARQAAVRTMNARVRATSWIDDQRLRASVLMLVTRTGQLRFEAEVSLQGTVSILTTDGTRFALLDLQKNELHQGPACPANVAALIRIPLLPEEVAAILLGDVHLDPQADDKPDQVSWDAERGADVLLRTDAGGRRTWLYFQDHGRDRELVAVVRDDGKNRLWQSAYDDQRSVSTMRLPGVIRFAEGNQSFDQGVEVKFKDVTINVVPHPENFTLAAPAGVATHEEACAP